MPFDPQFALSTMLPLAEAALDPEKLPKDWTLISSIQPDNFGYVAERNGITLIGFRGTQGEDEWMEDFDGLAVPNQLGKGTVHQGFEDQYLKIRASVVAALSHLKLLGELWITGHSLGGALSTLCASDSVNAGRKKLVYTFGSPRVGRADYADWFDALIPECYRIANEWDIVTRVPPSLDGYKHVGEQILVDGGRPKESGEFLHVAHSLELSYRPGIQKLIPPTPVLKAA
jgi:triacylglycerol lipase